jgi:hypothetical protein
MIGFEARWRASIVSIVAVLAFRAVPFLAFALASRTVGWRHKLAAALSFAILIAACARLEAPVRDIALRAPVALGYFALVALVAHRLGDTGFIGSEHRLAAFAGFWVLGVVVPCIAFPGPLAEWAVFTGWTVALSAYSYLVDTASMQIRPSASECVFFVVVNPVLVYAERGTPAPQEGRLLDGLTRISIGVGAWVSQDWIEAGASLLGGGPTGAPVVRGIDASITVAGAASLVARYFAQSGLASIQIGFMKLAGYRVPECYVYPLFSRSPREFWQRWNTWVGSWARRYVFLPASLALRRRYRQCPASVATAAMVLVTFVVVGLLHDFPLLVNRMRHPLDGWPRPRMSLFFGLSAAVLLVWLGAARLLMGGRVQKLTARIPYPLRAGLSAVAVLTSLLAAHGCATWLAERLPPQPRAGGLSWSPGELSHGSRD